MTNRVCMFLILAIMPLGASQPNYKILDTQKTETVASYVILTPSAQFSRDSALRIANDFLRENPQNELLRVGIYTDKTMAIDSKGKERTHFTYTQWLREFESRSQRDHSGAAELLKIGTESTLRIRYADRRVEEVPIAGQNVFRPTLDAVTIKLFNVAFVRQGFGAAKQIVPRFYFVLPQKVNLEQASALAKALLKAYDIPDLKIVLRHDQWFIFDTYYPWMNPFAPVQAPPTEPDLAQSEEFLCSSSTEQTCYQTSVSAKE